VFHLARVLRRAAGLYADRTAIVDGPVNMTYGELAGRVERLAAGLAYLGVRAGDRIALLDRNSVRNLETNFACAELGAILVPLNFRLAAAEIDAILTEVEAAALLCSDRFAGLLASLRNAPARIVTWGDADPLDARNDYERLLRSGSSFAPAPGSQSEAVAQIFFTSGTTGEPKGVCLSSGNLIASVFDSIATLAIGRDDVWLHAAPMFHLVDAFAIWTVTLVGGRHVAMHFDPRSFRDVVAREGVTKTSLPPTLIAMISELVSGSDPGLASLERISYGGMPMPQAVHARASAALGCPLLQAYGITETSGLVCQQLPGDEIARQSSVGQPAPAIELKIIDDAGRELGAGEIGELAVAGPRVTGGYWRNARATRAAIPDGWYRTGDLGRRDEDGHYYVVDRKKDMIISGGENVYSVEVENVLSLHPAIAEAAVFGVPNETWGEEVTAVVVLRDGSTATAEELIAHCRTRIGGYKIPRSIEFSPEPLPKTGPGKIAKNVLRARRGP
jgi:long-chain acyl-CoA synthetase